MFRVVSPGTPKQYESIYELRYTVLRAPWNQAKGSELDEFEDTSIHAMVSDESDTCIASGRLQFNSDSEAQIRYMAVDEKHRGGGLGKLILESLEQSARANSRKRIVLQARENALEFYKANGYSIEEKTFLLFGAVQHYLMSKNL